MQAIYLPINPIDNGIIINETAYNLSSRLSKKISYILDVKDFKEGIKKYVISKQKQKEMDEQHSKKTNKIESDQSLKIN